MGEGSHSAAKELREGVEGKLTEKIDLSIDVNRDVVERLQAARNRLAKKHRMPGPWQTRAIVRSIDRYGTETKPRGTIEAATAKEEE
jgi:hypothetical protein